VLRSARLGLDVSPGDPLAYAVAITNLTSTATIAILLPALRVSRTEPLAALRNP
jgi:ABC-type lipoprotein release transport system permease subunit